MPLTLDDFGIEIKNVSNGYTLRFPHPETGEIWVEEVIEEDEHDPLAAPEKLLWRLMEYFTFGGTKHDKERLRVVREKGGA